MKYYIAKIEGNYADEFDVNGFTLFTEKEYNDFSEVLRRSEFQPKEFYFGTNECVIFNSDELKKAITFKEISKKVFNIILEHVGDDFGILTPSRFVDDLTYLLEIQYDAKGDEEGLKFIEQIYNG